MGSSRVRLQSVCRTDFGEAGRKLGESVEIRRYTARVLAEVPIADPTTDAEHLGQLTAALRTAKLSWGGEPVVVRDNDPWTPWFLHRDELLLPLH